MEWQQLVEVWKIKKSSILWFSTETSITNPNFHLSKWSFPFLLLFELEAIYAESFSFFVSLLTSSIYAVITVSLEKIW